jgi:hypothetical protein
MRQRSKSSSARSNDRPAPLPVIEELRPGQSIELLKELHILTREGKLNQDTRRKLKQVYHLYQFIEPLLDEVHERQAGPVLVDHGAGKSYLGFILYDLYYNARRAARSEPGALGRIIGVETRSELVLKSRELAQRLGFERMEFLNLSVQQAQSAEQMPAQVDIVTALHACDTATDDAIAFGLAHQARHMVLVPCCQAEVAGVLRQSKALSIKRTPLAEIWRHPLHTREFGSQITNVLRCLQLQAHGYEVTVTELVGWEHSMKNELILASRPQQAHSGAARAAAERLQALLAEVGLSAMSDRFFVPAF